MQDGEGLLLVRRGSVVQCTRIWVQGETRAALRALAHTTFEVRGFVLDEYALPGRSDQARPVQ